MTTAHRPTFDPARGREPLRGPAFHQTTLPAHTQLKFRKPGQGGAAGGPERDLAAELLAAEAAHFAKKSGHQPRRSRSPSPSHTDDDDDAQHHHHSSTKRPLGSQSPSSLDAKRRKILEETREIDADETESDEEASESGSESESDDDDSDAELQRELDRVRREKEERRRREEAERAREEEEQRERDIALGNPLLNKQDFTMKRRWDDDVVFKNQARDTGDRGKKKEFVNDMLRSDFHKRFMNKYVR